MARLARYVVPGVAHRVTQRGNGRQRTFLSDADYAAYRDLLAEQCQAHGVAVWNWVLMPNHVHLVLVPEHADALRAALFAPMPGESMRGSNAPAISGRGALAVWPWTKRT